MHIVVGRRVTEVGVGQLLELAVRYERTVVDLGTGDGRAVIVEAAADPGALVIGIDADARTMGDRSRRAAATPVKGGHPNAVFVASGVELLPAGLDGIADRVTVRFPWGSLLRGAIGVDVAVSASIARLVSPAGTIELALSIVEHDRLGARDAAADAATDAEATTEAEAAPASAAAEPGPLPRSSARADPAFARLGRPFDEGDVERIRAVFGALGLRFVDVEPMTPAAVAGYGSSWARRLRVGRDRPAWRVRLAR
ncbi:MAG TPA: class I SAM-dependent methyltransferase [Candidatus Limnocylindrales bacterium]